MDRYAFNALWQQNNTLNTLLIASLFNDRNRYDRYDHHGHGHGHHDHCCCHGCCHGYHYRYHDNPVIVVNTGLGRYDRDNFYNRDHFFR